MPFFDPIHETHSVELALAPGHVHSFVYSAHAFHIHCKVRKLRAMAKYCGSFVYKHFVYFCDGVHGSACEFYLPLTKQGIPAPIIDNRLFQLGVSMRIIVYNVRVKTPQRLSYALWKAEWVYSQGTVNPARSEFFGYICIAFMLDFAQMLSCLIHHTPPFIFLFILTTQIPCHFIC